MVPYMHSVSISSSGFCTRHVTTRQTLTCLSNMDKLCYTQIMLRHDICSSRLHSMLWLPVQRRVEFKIACLAHKSITSTALTYLSADIQLCLSMVVIIFAHLPTEHSLFHTRIPLSTTEVLPSQDCVCGTVYRLL